MNVAKIRRRLVWMKATLAILAFLCIPVFVADALNYSEAELGFPLLLVASFVLFLLVFGLFARSLGESGVSWVATILSIPIAGIVLTYLELGRLTKKAFEQERWQRFRYKAGSSGGQPP